MKCDLCGKTEFKLLYDLKPYKIYECKFCKLRVTDQDSIKAKKGSEMYSEEYFKEVHPKFFGVCDKTYPKHVKHSKKLQNFWNVANTISNYIPNKGKVLDIGCATGVFLDMMQHKGFEPYGVDISDYASKYARDNFGVKTFKGKLEDSKFKDEFFDVITMWDFIEHVNNPTEILNIANRLLRKGGMLFILTINDDSLMESLSRMSYNIGIKRPAEIMHPVHHVHHYTDATLRALLHKTGFHIIKKEKSEMPLENVEGSTLIRSAYVPLVAISNLLHRQHEVRVFTRRRE